MTSPIVHIHGGGCSAACWRDTLPLSSGKVLAFDFSYADLDEAGIGKAVFAGHSLGGAMVNEIIRRYPHRAAGMNFVAAPFPRNGGTVASVCTPEIQASFTAAYATGATIMAIPQRALAASLFGNDMDDVMIARMHADLVSETLSVFMELVDFFGLRGGIPSLYIKLILDAALPLARGPV